jgi:hypothetical protein
VIIHQVATDAVCDSAASVTANTTICAPEPSDGFRLQAGQAVVFIYDSSCDAGFSVAAGGFLIDADGANSPGCAADQIVGAVATLNAAPAPPPPCVPAPLCQARPRKGCRDAGKSLIALQDNAIDAKDALAWKWDEGAATDVTAFGDPANGATDYAFCLYETVVSTLAVPPVLALQVAVPAHGTCGSNPCWNPSPDGSGFRYTDGAATSDGVKSVLLQAGADGEAKVTVKSGGINLPLPPPADASHLIAQHPRVRVQLVNREGECWESVYLLPATKSDLTHFKDKY